MQTSPVNIEEYKSGSQTPVAGTVAYDYATQMMMIYDGTTFVAVNNTLPQDDGFRTMYHSDGSVVSIF